jgi:DNA-binding LacI/PurR family transcriptional regulator
MSDIKKRVTSVDVARAAGVSQSVVSRTFTPGGKVAAKTRARVLSVARELGYYPNMMARNLVKRGSNIVGIIMADITNPFYPYVLQKFTLQLQARGRQVLLLNVMSEDEIGEAIKLALQYQVEAIIVTSMTLPFPLAEACAETGVPVILFNRYIRDPNVLAVSCDNVEGGRMVANAFLDAGHSRLAFVGGKPETSTNEDRKKGFTDRIAERGHNRALVLEREYSYAWGYEASQVLFGGAERPDAVFCANDIVALGVLDAVRHEFGMTVPENASVIGFDDIPMASWPAYSLTTIRQPVNAMIDRTLTLLEASRNETGIAPGGIQLIAGTMVCRSTTRLPVSS